jgi:hypothetical protein
MFIKGILQTPDNRPASGVLIRAYDMDFRRRPDVSLGEATTGRDGSYEITYTADQLTQSGRPDLQIRAFDPRDDRLLGGSDILFNAPEEATINLTLTPSERPVLSEYERLINTLSPIVGDVSFATLTDDDTAFLAGKTGTDRQRIETLRQAAVLTRQTKLPTDLFYGFGRRNLSLDLDNLLSQDTSTLRDALLDTIEETIIPDLSDDLDSILANLDQRKLGQGLVVNYSLLGQLLDQETEAPLVGYKITATMLAPATSENDDLVDLGQDTTQTDGGFVFTYTAPRLPADPEAAIPQRSFGLTVATSAGEPFYETEVTLTIGDTDPVELAVIVPPEPDRSPRLPEVNDALNLTLSPALQTVLAEQNLQTLADIRSTGGLQTLAAAPDDPAAATLDAHANLNLLTDDIQQNQKLIDRRFTNIQAIAGVSQAKFVSAVADDDDLTELEAARLHAVAQAETAVLDNLLTQIRVDTANGLPSPLADETDDGNDPITALTSQACQCQGCDTAVSPLAYLADLLDYTTTHLNNGSSSVTLGFLTDTFHQPFGQLPTACDAFQDQERQIRLCIEVLRQYLAANSPDAEQQVTLDQAEQAYRTEAYTTLLNQIGTSYEELQAARSADPKERKTLADRLGLSLTQPDPLNALFIDPDALTEYDLEKQFGLVDTRRDRLSTGAKTGDTANQINRWSFEGVEWNQTTDVEGNIYLSLSRSSDETLVNVYQDRDRTQLIASGSRSSIQGTVQLLPENNSLLSGTVKIDYQADATDIEISVIPDLLSWQLQHLRDLWQQLDWPTADGNDGNEDSPIPNRHPFIDPDQSGPGDLRTIDPADPVLMLWQARRDQLDSAYEALKQAREDNGDSISSLLARDEVGLLVADLDAIADRQADGDDIAADLTASHLTPADFAHIQRMRRLAEESATILAREWADFYAALTQIFKRRQLANWHEQERTLNGAGNTPLTLSPDEFQVPDNLFADEFPQPKTVPSYAWQATLRDRRDWQKQLSSRVEQQQTLSTALQATISRTEEFTLPQLRDALIAATSTEEQTLEAKAKAIRDRLLIETQASSCQQTTRIAQAIETLQSLVWSVRTSQLQDTYPDLNLDTDNFDEEWQWLGSYTSWRSAMFVFLYPENILLPQLRRWQTPAFRSLVNDIRNNRRLTPTAACQAAHRYAQYFEDICKLRLDASVIAQTKTYEEGDRCQKTYKGDRDLIYLFARGGVTNTVYVSWYDPKDDMEYAQSFWEPVPGLENPISIVGAAAYTISSVERYIYLFVRVGNESEQQLVYTKYDLEQARWSGTTTPLDLPEGATIFTAVVKQRNRDNESPHLAIRIPNGAIYTRRLDQDGADWEAGDWYPTVGRAKGREFSELLAMLEPAPGEYYLFARHEDQLSYRLFGPWDDGIWNDVGVMRGAWLGGFPLSGSKRIYAFWRLGSGSAVFYQSFERVSKKFKLSFWNKFTTFNDWLRAVTGVSLSNLTISDGTKYSGMNLLDFFTLIAENDPHQLDVQVANTNLNNLSELLQHYHRKQAKFYIKTLAGSIESSDDPEWKDWKLADDMVRQFSSNRKSLKTILANLIDKVVNTYKKERNKEEDNKLEKSLQEKGLDSLERILFPAGKWPNGLPVLLSYKRTFKLRNKSNKAQFNFSLSLDFDSLNAYIGPDSRTVFNRAVFRHDPSHKLTKISAIPIAPTVSAPFDITEKLTDADLQRRRRQIRLAFNQNSQTPASVLTYLEEAWSFAPIYLALQLQQRRQFTAALDWFRTVYDYSASVSQRNIYSGFKREEGDASSFRLSKGWLLDPLNPHAIAASRAGTYNRFTLISLIRCFLDFADTEFTRDTAESLPRAKTLYQTALELLDLPELRQNLDACREVIISIDFDLDVILGDVWNETVSHMKAQMSKLSDSKKLQAVAANVQAALRSSRPIAERITTAQKLIQQSLIEQRQSPELQAVIETNVSQRSLVKNALLKNPGVAKVVSHSGQIASRDFVGAVEAIVNQTTFNQTANNGQSESTRAYPAKDLQSVRKVRKSSFAIISYPFCISPNPILQSLKFQAEVNLFKLQNCRNIAGDEREVATYSSATDTDAGLLQIDASGQLTTSNAGATTSTSYRYEVLVERAKQLVQLAAQIESNFLAALEKRDAEYYTLIKARQDVQLSRSEDILQNLRVMESEGRIKLTALQQESNQLEFEYYTNLIRNGYSTFESLSLRLLESVAGIQYVAAASNFIAAATPSLESIFSLGSSNLESFGRGLEQLATALGTTSQIFSTYANYERRQQGWKFQRNLARQNIRIGNQQIELAKDQARIIGQERLISKMKTDFTESTVEFLANKFTNADLYDWMSNVLEGVYSFFLQQATAAAKLAEQQLAFERQEIIPALIQSDYWVAQIGDLPVALDGGEEANRRGLTGSARLLADLYNLDQYRFDTERRKLQLTKTISLASQSPAEFHQFRQTGVLSFATPMSLFDQDFPGHYLRLIKRVRTSVIALIPPVDGIHATLSTDGISRVVTKQEIRNSKEPFKVIKRDPESIALSSPREATGLFELTPQSHELLLPFEGIGVDTQWKFQLPKPANSFDYSTIADVLITIEYTALDDDDYRRKVIQKLDRTTSGDRAFSLRNQFPDAWFDLNNPEQSGDPLVARFDTRREDFPPNIEELRIQHLVLYLVPKDDISASETIPVTLTLKPLNANETDALTATAMAENIISTRRTSGNAWAATFTNQFPVGDWGLELPANLASQFEAEAIEDILLVVTYQGRTPAWPE